jgi:hypothetical protein
VTCRLRVEGVGFGFRVEGLGVGFGVRVSYIFGLFACNLEFWGLGLRPEHTHTHTHTGVHRCGEAGAGRAVGVALGRASNVVGAVMGTSAGSNSQKVLFMVTSGSKHTRALTFENVGAGHGTLVLAPEIRPQAPAATVTRPQ